MTIINDNYVLDDLNKDFLRYKTYLKRSFWKRTFNVGRRRSSGFARPKRNPLTFAITGNYREFSSRFIWMSNKYLQIFLHFKKNLS